MIWRARRGSGNMRRDPFERASAVARYGETLFIVREDDVGDVTPVVRAGALDDPHALVGAVGLRLRRGVGKHVQPFVGAALLLRELEEVVGELRAPVIDEAALERFAVERARLPQKD